MADRNNLPAGLLEDVKNQLDGTWSDEATDRKYAGFIAQGMSWINDMLGENADYTADGDPRAILMEYVRYARDQALDVFENNYRAMILNAQQKLEVKRFVESTKQTEG